MNPPLITPTLLIVLVLFCLSTIGAQQQESNGSKNDDPSGTPEHQFAISIPELQQTHYQSLDSGQGRYSFGYALPDQMREESRSADGQVSGSYFYRDPNGNANQVQYRADKSGFRVTANNQPVQDTAEVAEARQRHLKIWESIANHNRALQQQQKEVTSDGALSVEAESRTPNKDYPPHIEKEHAAPPDLEPVPQFQPVADSPATHNQQESILNSLATHNQEKSSPEVIPVAEALNIQDTNKPLLINFDDEVDDEKDAIITGVVPTSNNADSSVIEIDSEPIKLLAQLYAKHLENNKNPPGIIPRPEGFHPQISEPASGFDLFSRFDLSDKESIEVINPEYVDLRAFLLTNRFREGDEQMKQAESSMMEGNQEPHILIHTKEKDVMTTPFSEPNHDLLTSNEDEPDRYQHPYNSEPYVSGSYYPSSQLYNQYYNLDSDKHIYITRESWNELPESLKLAMMGLGSVDGEHTAQVSPAQNHNKNVNSYKTKQVMPNIYSPHSSYYSPYYYYNHLKSAAAAAGYHNSPYYYYPTPSKNYYGEYSKNPESHYYNRGYQSSVKPNYYPYYYDPYYYY